MQYGRVVIVTAVVRDRHALREWINHRNSSVRKVAEAATRAAERQRGEQGEPIRVSPSTVGHLITGHQKHLSPKRAELIEHVLDVPRGSLFAYKLTNVVSDERQSA